MSSVRWLPPLQADGGVQMAFDDGLLATATGVIARQYTWDPPALSLGKFQKVELGRPLPFTVVRRPSGGRAVLHGAEFEWSFAVVFATTALADRRVETPYALVADAFADALRELGVPVEETRSTPYQHSGLCFASALRHDIMAAGAKIVALAQAQRAEGVLVHGSVLEHRPPAYLVDAVEELLDEPWQGDGLAASGVAVARDKLWRSVLERLETALAGELSAGRPDTDSRSPEVAT
ncbi:MAG: biotin/lipoate A/B protein ligase family protein [Thermoleophilia bacterium]